MRKPPIEECVKTLTKTIWISPLNYRNLIKNQKETTATITTTIKVKPIKAPKSNTPAHTHTRLYK